ncbi:hypothetical protein ALI144C_44875 [Actinosynnema sp. ALI-1.44]|uniref:terminase small subunit n=1 Tax=Actinosynnema sp. ALI-1.44 TaxID=1933779 RepID=UPI0009D4E72B|nr:hypothetical protein [Actinosynnema sp. ALI-1.44]ONI73088.1 hypothetical protein ALI144C_44875 [Actinosynnema sp. ALI-1.44]
MLREALDTALTAVKHDPRDAAVVALARAYADAIDRGDVLKAGPPLLSALRELQMTPASRSAPVEGGAPSDGDTDELDELDARRAERAERAERRRAAAGQHDTPPVD